MTDTDYEDNTEEMVDSLPQYYPREEESSNYKILKIVGNRVDELDTSIQELDNATNVQTADTSEQLKEHSKLVDLKKRQGESREQFRSRIIGKFQLLTSEGTIEDLFIFISEVLGTNVEDIRYNEFGDFHIKISIPGPDIRNSSLTNDDIVETLKILLPAGYNIETESRGDLFYITPEQYETGDYDTEKGYDTLDEDGEPTGNGGTYSGFI